MAHPFVMRKVPFARAASPLGKGRCRSRKGSAERESTLAQAEFHETIAARGGFAKADIEFVASTPALSVFPPLVIPELLWIRQLQRRPGLAKYRHTLICALRRSA